MSAVRVVRHRFLKPGEVSKLRRCAARLGWRTFDAELDIASGFVISESMPPDVFLAEIDDTRPLFLIRKER